MNDKFHKWPWVRDPRFIQDKNLPLYIQLQNEIKALVDNLYWLPGEQIPTEADICKGLGMSINTVKKGLHRLVIDGYLIRRQGYGTFVASMVERPGTSHPMVDENDRLIEPITTRLLYLGKEKAAPEIAAHLQIQSGDAIYALKRLRSWGDEPVSFFYEWIIARLFPNLEDISQEEFNTFPMMVLLEKYYGLTWRKSTELLSVRKPEPFVAQALNVSANDPLLFSETTNKTNNDVVLEYRNTYIVTSKYRYFNDR